MSRRLLSRLSIASAALVLATQAQAVEILHWDRKPLPVDLPVGTERVIVLDRNVRVGLPPEIADSETLRVQSAGGAIYLKADKPFDTQRVRLQDVETNEVVLFDLTAMETGASDEEIQVVFPEDDHVDSETASSSDSQEQDDGSSSSANTPVPVVLTRYAAQSLYAPTRTIEPVQGVNRVAMRLPESLPSLLPALPVSATPVAAWKLDGWTVTAVKLSNRDPSRAFELDPRWLQGDLFSATFMHPTLGRRGSVRDTTTVFIVTDGVSLAQAVPLSASVAEDHSVHADAGGDS
ncbi:TIGR03749 family integrating conjugative element protein [Salinicola sp. LHM]|uniref:TIGR03749 family integrating conjugative element protein n=1 Tax=Halomonadaceae TaxID=28256 RepID=UPI00068F2F26|nr:MULTISPECIES: TIGR03749 family integrating conjugative element protein [Halomonadaceae]MDF9434643.1 TIGR03749 family integrating conjugative element protein [Chromohalobacter israelensis]WQH33469.1 TIGR03749 family integrating conjugative element protein [Salinicola sp. LHM]